MILAVVGQRLRLPGDFRIPVRGRVYYVPPASTVLLTLIVWALSRILSRPRSPMDARPPSAAATPQALGRLALGDVRRAISKASVRTRFRQRVTEERLASR